ncbi:protein-disulfide reductase DsbD family protein [Sphingomonas sp. TX0543]|uniref:protein-disulfide reductase DsbD family protein n=1 Tax=unclassified Sphingomonas TaxID=196159 RepID=UPI0010F4482A|nr:protein-disulfide reductase DsbD domain-containing protein [Sphingomonas sp. 3P27F8]
MARQAWFRRIVALLVGLMTMVAQPAAADQHVAMRLVAETPRPAAGGTVTLAFDAVPAPGWHAYWQNPGDAGVGTRLAWTLPSGARAGELRYPVPQRLLIAGLMNYVFERPFAMLVDVQIPAGLAPGTPLPISVKADYLVCTADLCVPETQTLQTALIVGDGAADPALRARFDAWRRALPQPLGASATWQAAAGVFRLGVPFPAAAPIRDAYFYPLAGGAVDYAAPQKIARDGDRLVVEAKLAAVPASGRIAGVLATGEGRGLAILANPGVVAPADAAGGVWGSALLAFAGAVLGGLLLNIMPCVFPILSLKALGLARAGETEAIARRESLAYAAGVILVCLALGGGLLALRAGGSAVGWAFQLQDPRVIGVLLLLVAGLALNLAGLFELPTPRFAGKSGTTGAFATGALAAFVATPCSGPFMGAALGAALVLPTAAALMVFAGLGFGIALPFLLIGFVPAFRRRLPKPGPWMVRLRHILSIPMFLTAAALGWVLWRQAGGIGLVLAAIALILLALGLWWTGWMQGQGRERAWWPGLTAIPAALMAMALLHPGAARPATTIAGAERFSEARLAALRAEGRPVFAYFTADWCLTCKVNEKTSIETERVARAFSKGKVAVLVGDWTDGDPALGRFIEANNRAGVPLYLWYAPGAREPRLLPQLLTPDMLTGLAGT